MIRIIFENGSVLNADNIKILYIEDTDIVKIQQVENGAIRNLVSTNVKVVKGEENDESV